jgi:hypothetical protein
MRRLSSTAAYYAAAFARLLQLTDGVKTYSSWYDGDWRQLQSPIELVCRESGFEPPVICTPEELLKE